MKISKEKLARFFNIMGFSVRFSKTRKMSCIEVWGPSIDAPLVHLNEKQLLYVLRALCHKAEDKYKLYTYWPLDKLEIVLVKYLLVNPPIEMESESRILATIDCVLAIHDRFECLKDYTDIIPGVLKGIICHLCKNAIRERGSYAVYQGTIPRVPICEACEKVIDNANQGVTK